MSKQRRSISRRISITLMVLAMPIFVISLSSFYNHSQKLLHREVMERSTSILSTTLQRVVKYMGSVAMAAKANEWLLEEHFVPDSLLAMSRRIVRLNHSVVSCTIGAEPNAFPEYGRYFSVYSVNEDDTIITVLEPDYEYFEKAWYKETIQKGKPCWVNPFRDFNAGTINPNEAIASYCIPLRPNGRHIAGVVSADFSFERLRETILATEHPYPDSYYIMLDEEGRYLVHPNSSLLFKKSIFSQTDSVEHADIVDLGREMTSGNRGVTHVVIDDELCHVCYAPVPDTQWSIALISPDDEILVDYRHLGYLIVGLIALGLLLIMWLTHRVVRHNIQPLGQLLDITTKMSEGNYDEIIPHSDRKDVIAQLQNSFAEMQKSIVSHINAIRQTSEVVTKQNAELTLAVQQADISEDEKNAFVQGVMRQLRKPLNIIEGLIGLFISTAMPRTENKDASTHYEDLDNIIAALRHNSYILNRRMLMLHDISEEGTANWSVYNKTDEVRCNDLARECIGYTQKFYSGEVNFETELPDSAHLHTNHLYLMRSIREFLINSIKYSDGKNIYLRLSQTESTFRFVIEDTGPGLSDHAQMMISQPFAKVEKMSDGLGIGLPLSKRHITHLGGELIYDETYHDGCRFIIEMPK